MAISKSPPQAYTKELLTKAYNWLLNQPESIRYQARDADTLIQLYQLSLRRSSTEETVRFHEIKRTRNENFHGELKNLLGLMDELEGEQPEATSQHFQSPFLKGVHPSGQSGPVSSQDEVGPDVSFRSGFAHLSPREAPFGTKPHEAKSQSPTEHGQNLPRTTASIFQFDQTTLLALRRAQSLLNLSTEDEALRALVQIGLHDLERNLARKG